MSADNYDYAAEAATWPELTPEAKRRLAELLRPSGRRLERISERDVDEVLDGVRATGEVA